MYTPEVRQNDRSRLEQLEQVQLFAPTDARKEAGYSVDLFICLLV